MAENSSEQKEREVTFDGMNTGENEKKFNRFQYIENGTYTVDTNKLKYDKNGLLTIKFTNESSVTWVYIASFDGVAYTTKYKSEYENAEFSLSKVVAHILKGSALKNANKIVRKAPSWEQAVRDLRAEFGTTFKVKVTQIAIGTEDPEEGADVAVTRLWNKKDDSGKKYYTIKGVKHLYSMEVPK